MLHLYIFSNSPSSIASDIPTWEGAPHLLMEIVSRLSCILQLTMVLNGAESSNSPIFSLKIQKHCFSKYSWQLWQHFDDAAFKCLPISTALHFFFFFWSQICSWAEVLSRTVPCTACPRELELRNHEVHTRSQASLESSLIIMNSSEFFSRGSAHDRQGRLYFLIFSRMDKQ